jgi:hypothetical protein
MEEDTDKEMSKSFGETGGGEESEEIHGELTRLAHSGRSAYMERMCVEAGGKVQVEVR